MQGWGLLLFEGILGIVAGAIALIWPGITALAFLSIGEMLPEETGSRVSLPAWLSR